MITTEVFSHMHVYFYDMNKLPYLSQAESLCHPYTSASAHSVTISPFQDSTKGSLGVSGMAI